MNGKQHRQIGAACGAGYTIAKYLSDKQDNPELAFPWGDFLLNTSIGYFLGGLPDWIEPATNPNHRKLFHSLTAAVGVGYVAFGEHTKNWTDEARTPIQATALAYLSHLAVDFTTAKSIPFIHPKLF